MTDSQLATAREQLAETIVPNLAGLYTFRSSSSNNYWFMTGRQSGKNYSIKYGGKEVGWIVRSVDGTEAERRFIVTKLNKLVRTPPESL